MKKDAKRKSFVFYIEWQEVLMEYPAEVRLEVYDAIIEYAASGTLSELKPLAKMAFSFIKKQIDSNNDKYNCLVEKRSEAGRKGMASRYGTSVTNLTSGNNANYNEPDNEPDNKSLSNAQAREEFPPPEVFDKPLDELYAILLKSEIWREDVIRRAFRMGYRDFSVKDFEKFLELYILKLRSEGKNSKSENDAKEHFSNWLMIELKKQEDDKRRAKSFSTTATNSTGEVVRSEAESDTDRKSVGETQKDYSARF